MVSKVELSVETVEEIQQLNEYVRIGAESSALDSGLETTVTPRARQGAASN